MVEHGFAGDAKSEAEWNTWYSQHARHGFAKIPGWRSAQRFVALPPSQPKYRAMYSLASADVMTSDAYKATTGGRFPEAWRSMITDFHRNLADAEWMPAVELDQCLVVVDPPATGLELPGVELSWLAVVGLECTVPRRALAVVDRANGERISRLSLPHVSVYSPVFERFLVQQATH